MTSDIRNWDSNIEQHSSEGVNKILIGNKCDWAEKREIKKEQGQELADELGIDFLETSAKSSINVEEAFFTLARAIKKRLIDAHAQEQQNHQNKRLELDNNRHLKSINMNTDSSDQMFYNFRLRRIVKENHGKNINQISLFFNLNNYEAPIGPEYIKKYNKLGYVIRDVKDTSNILATVADIQASIYDNEHCGDHLDIMSNFVAGEHIDLETNELLTCCWLHRKDDAILAVAGTLGKIYLISLAFSLTFKTLNGHTGTITDLRKYPNDDQHLMSASRDNTVRIWHVDNGTCLYIIEINAFIICWHPTGQTFLTGNNQGEIRIWYTPNLTETSNKPIHLSKKNIYTKFKKIHSTQIDEIKFVNDSVISKSIDNKIEHWDYETFKIIKTFNIKDNCFNRCRFDVSLDGKYMCVGTSYGSVFIYNITKGKLVTELSHRRSTKAVKCCLFTRDYKQIIAAGQEGFICRYDYISDKTLAEWDEW
ncbi:6092_t:CDS:10, partial [Entrophospora sp. SA101]